MTKKIPIGLGVFTLTFFLMASLLYAQESRTENPQGSTAAVPASENSIDAPVTSSAGTDPVAPEVSEDVRDPFGMFLDEDIEIEAPEEAEVVALTPPPTLRGLGLGGGKAYAILDEEMYMEGETKNGIKLVEVMREKAKILLNGSEMTLVSVSEEELEKAQQRREEKSEELVLSHTKKENDPESFPGRESPIS